MFHSVNDLNAHEAQRLLSYELLQIAKRLTGSQIRLVAAIYEFRYDQTLCGNHPQIASVSVDSWFNRLAQLMGHSVAALIELDEGALMGCKLISGRNHHDPNSAPSRNARLTDLGDRFCWALKN